MNLYRLDQLYQFLLHCYPSGFRNEFGEEMQEVFRQSAQEAAGQSAWALYRLCLGELVGLPASLMQAHRRAREAVEAPAAPFEKSWRELLLTLTVFLLPASLFLIRQTPPAQPFNGLPIVLLFLAVMVALGWLGGLPLRTARYIGAILVIAGYLYVFQWITSLVSPALMVNFSPLPGRLDHGSYLVLKAISTGMLWLILFCLTLLIIALLAVFNRMQPLLAGFQQDWTLLSYVLYGEAIFALLLFQGYRSEPSYNLACLLCLGAGVWSFQHSARRWQRLLALLSCLTLAVAIALLGTWQPGLPWDGLHSAEARRLLLAWSWMIVALLLPGLLARLPSRPSHADQFTSL